VTYVKDAFLDVSPLPFHDFFMKRFLKRVTPIQVKVQYKAWDDWTDCFTIEKLELPANPFLGFSAMTGDVSDAHEYVFFPPSPLF